MSNEQAARDRKTIALVCGGSHCPGCRQPGEAGDAARGQIVKAFPVIGEMIGDPCTPRGLLIGVMPASLPPLRATIHGQPIAATTMPAEPIQPVLREKWPWWANAIADEAQPPDKGVGDTIERLLGAGGESFKALAKAAWKGCNCDARQRTLNAKYPYTPGVAGTGSKGV